MNNITRMKELVGILNKANKAYYGEDREIMSNFEYDKLYDELVDLEKETNTILSKSPTRNPGCEVMSKLKKDTHEAPALSLDKIKDREALREWLGEKEGVLSEKLDGLTIVLTYDNGELKKAVTRGNGITGEIITHNCIFFEGVPHKIPYAGRLILRGEALITYSEFERINSEIEEVVNKYKNPRNLASGTVRQLDSNVVVKRKVNFKAFSLVKADITENSYTKQLEWLGSLGFDLVEYVPVSKENLLEEIEKFEEKVKVSDVPTDGLVLFYDDVAYGESLGKTGKFPRNGKAFKWQDETAITTLRNVEWSASRLGSLNPVCIFDPVELEGTTVSRASVHNLSVVKELKLGINDEIVVFKANMIIPQLLENISKSDNLEIPDTCPICGGGTEIIKNNDTEVLFCSNPDCAAKNVGRFAHFVKRDAMNIEGLSDATLERLIDVGYVTQFADLYHLDRYKDEICSMEGFGEKSYENIIEAVENSRKVKFANFLYSFGISNVGRTVSKDISNTVKGYNGFIERLNKSEGFSDIEGIGNTIDISIFEWSNDQKRMKEFEDMVKEVEFIDDFNESDDDSSLAGKTFVITGSVEKFKNRNEIKALIESKGGKVAGSVSKNTDYLLNNDTTSGSSKNKKAKELNIPIINEDDFLKMI